MKNTLISVAIALVVGLVIGYAFHNTDESAIQTSTPGTTFATAKLPAIAVSLASAGANGTSTSLQNNTGQDAFITSIKAFCTAVGTSKTAYTGAGLASLTLSVGTSSTAAPAVIPTNLVGGGSVTIATSSGYFSNSSSTAQVPGSVSAFNIWANGSYLTFWFNATNTAVCTVGVDTLSS